MEAKRPWQIYVIVVLGILPLNSFLFWEISRLMGISDLESQPAIILRLALTVVLIFLNIRLIKLEKWAGYTIAGLFGIIGGAWAYALTVAFIAGKSIPSPTNTTAPVLVIICGAVAGYLARPRFWKRMAEIKKKIEEQEKKQDADKHLLK